MTCEHGSWRQDVTLTIPGTPPLWRRARVAVRGGHARHYTDDATRSDEARVAAAARAIRIPPGVPVSVVIDATWPRPARRPAWVPVDAWKSGRRIRRISRPDVDNASKAIMDGLRRCWGDDAQVTTLHADGWIAAVGQLPCTVVMLDVLGWVEEATCEG